jgi:hypothetical protein
MVFIAMNSDEVMNRTAQYQIQYAPAPYRQNSLRGSGDFERSEIDPIISIRHGEDGTTITTARRRTRRFYSVAGSDEHPELERRMAQMPEEFGNTLQPFRITTECSEDDESDNESPPRLGRREIYRIGALPFESDSSDEVFEHRLHSQQEPTIRERTRELDAAVEASQQATQEAVRAVGGELMTPHARFHIEKDKSKCTLRFDPPVSGRFILLKMWSPHLDPTSNIDIQAVIARGFAGPRYFPSVQLR